MKVEIENLILHKYICFQILEKQIPNIQIKKKKSLFHALIDPFILSIQKYIFFLSINKAKLEQEFIITTREHIRSVQVNCRTIMQYIIIAERVGAVHYTMIAKYWCSKVHVDHRTLVQYISLRYSTVQVDPGTLV